MKPHSDFLIHFEHDIFDSISNLCVGPLVGTSGQLLLLSLRQSFVFQLSAVYISVSSGHILILIYQLQSFDVVYLSSMAVSMCGAVALVEGTHELTCSSFQVTIAAC